MQRLLRFCFLMMMVCAAFSGNATHITGMDLNYEHISGNTYKVTLYVYGECGPPAFGNLLNATPKILLENNGALYSTLTLSQVGNGVEVTPVCSALAGSTTCSNPNNAIRGVTRYIYSTNVTLPYTSSNWIFRFDGNMPAPGVMGQAGRINTLANTSGTTVTALEAKLNNLQGYNSSPIFTTLPTPFYCINVPQQYNLGASDPDADSLSFALVPGLNAGGGTVSYVSPYSATYPLATAAGAFSSSAITGQTNFTPNATGVYLIVQQVSEFRNGVLVGTSMREMNFTILSPCNSTPASNAIDTSQATNAANPTGFIASATDFNLCTGADSVRFNIVAYNPGNDTIVASVAGLPGGSTAAITNNNSTAPVVTFSWVKPNVPAGNYTFYVTYKDDGCPLSSTQTQAYTVHVYEPNVMNTSIAAPTQCVHKALVDYRFAYGLVPRIITLSQNGTVVRSFRDSTGHVLDSLGTGIYDVSISSPKLGCASYYSLQVVDSGVYPSRPEVISPVFYCKYAQAIRLDATPDSGATVHWYTAGGTGLTFPPTPRTDTTGIFYWLVDQKYKVCTSLRDTVQVYVTLRPIASIDAPATICLNDTAIISFNGTVGIGPILDYHWDFDSAGYYVGEGPGPWSVHWYDTGTKLIHLQVDENKCASLPVDFSLFVKPIPYAGFFASDVCQYDTMTVRYSTKPAGGQLYAWDFPGANIPTATGPGPYTLSWTDSGTKHLVLTADLNGCLDKRYRDIVVHPAPVAGIRNAPSSICVGDKILLIAHGGLSYTWSEPGEWKPLSAADMYVFTILKPQALQVSVANEWGCADTAAISFNDVQPCCQFSYPDAFTPNGDSRNDRFHIVTYGNQLEFALSIYNRWGQRVYYGLDAAQGWDGTYGGKPCEPGIYFYYLAAKCYTGRQEEHKGELMLVR